MTSTDRDLSPQCFSLYRQLRPAASSSLWCVLNANSTGQFHASQPTVGHHGVVGPSANTKSCHDNGTQTSLSPAQHRTVPVLPPGMRHKPASAPMDSGAVLPTWLERESPEHTKPPQKPGEIQAPTCQQVPGTASLQRPSSGTV